MQSKNQASIVREVFERSVKCGIKPFDRLSREKNPANFILFQGHLALLWSPSTQKWSHYVWGY